MKSSKTWKFIGSNAVSLATISFGLIVIFLDQIKWIRPEDVPSVILAVLALLATSEVIERRGKLSKIEERLDDVAEQLKSVRSAKVIRFSNPEEALEYLTKRTREATESIDQASIDQQRSRNTHARQKYIETRQEIVLADRLKFRYVGVLHETRRLEESFRLINGRKLNRYFSGFYLKPSPQIPMMNFNVFDKKEVFTRHPYGTGQDESYVAIQSSEIAEIFTEHFQRLWEESTKLENEEDYNRLLKLVIQNTEAQV